MNQLSIAITLEVGFRHQQLVNEVVGIDSPSFRRAYFVGEVRELRQNSGFTVEAQFQIITAQHVIEAIEFKLDAYFRSLQFVDDGFKVHYVNGGTPYHCKTNYKRQGDAIRAVEKLNARQGGGYAYSKVSTYIAKNRAKLVRNIMSGHWVMESTGTNFTNSVASESYWSA